MKIAFNYRSFDPNDDNFFGSSIFKIFKIFGRTKRPKHFFFFNNQKYFEIVRKICQKHQRLETERKIFGKDFDSLKPLCRNWTYYRK